MTNGHTELPLQHYGAAMPTRKAKPASRLNLGGICLALFLPWLLFCAMFAVMSFSLHYKEKMVCYLLVFASLVLCLILAKSAYDEIQAGANASWSLFLAAACFLGHALGVALGDLNYFYHMEPYYDTVNLNTYPDLNPATWPAQMVMDAGQVTFSPGSKVNASMAMAFHNSETYCVAPIVNGNAQTQYDFWAAGLNCCTGASSNNAVMLSDYACGEYNNPAASSGLRVMREDQREFFRLAVKQAENAYSIKAKHPMFFHWMEDPSLELAAYQDEGTKYFLLGVYAFFALLLFLVIVAVICLHTSS